MTDDRPWATATTATLAAWPTLVAPLVGALSAGDLPIPTAPAEIVDGLAAELSSRMLQVARASAQIVAHDAAGQGVDSPSGAPDEDRLNELAATFAGLITAGYASAATQAALAVPLTEGRRLKAAAAAVSSAVRTALTALGTAVIGLVPTHVGAAMAAAEHEGSVAVYQAHPPRYLVAAETHEGADRCEPCTEINGTRYDTLAAALEDYPTVGYRRCRGGIRCRGELRGVWSEDPQSANLAEAGPAETHTGAMLALVPAADDASRLAVDGGEPAEELHCTIAYLGKADQIDAAARQQLIAATTAAVQGMPVVDADAFGLASFGQAGPEPCNVLNVGGDMLDAAHHFLTEFISFDAPDQHAPWNAHVTLEYTDDLGRLKQYTDRLGPIRFDRVRLAIGGDVVDIPLLDEEPVVEDDGFDAWLAGESLTEADVHPGDGQLKRYWLGKGLDKWATSPHPWTALYRHLRKYITNPALLKKTVSRWYIDHFGHTPNQRIAERFDPAQHRANDGKWSRLLASAHLKVGGSTLRLDHHGGGRVSVHDEHGGSLHMTRDDLASGRRGGSVRTFAYTAPLKTEKAGDREWLRRTEDRAGKPWTTALAGLHKTHVASGVDVEHDDPYLHDRHTLHLSPGSKGLDDPAELFNRPGTPMTGQNLHDLADTLRAFADGHDDVDTGHGRVTMGVTGRDFTFDTGKRNEQPIILSRGELRSVEKALTAAHDAHNPDGGNPLPAGEQFQRSIPTKSGGTIAVTRAGPESDLRIASDTTTIRISSDMLPGVAAHIDTMLAVSGELKHLTPVVARPVTEAQPGRRVELMEAGSLQAL